MSKHTILPVALLAVEIPTSRNILSSFSHSVSSSNPLSPSSPLVRKISVTSPPSSPSKESLQKDIANDNSSSFRSTLSSSSSSNSLSNSVSTPKKLEKASIGERITSPHSSPLQDNDDANVDEDEDALTSNSNYSSGSSSTNSLSESTFQTYQQQQQLAINLGKLRNSNSPLLDELRERFLTYLDKHQDSATSHEMRVKIMFLGKFLNPSTMKVKSIFGKHQEFINRVIEEFCHDLSIECDLTDKNIQPELSISTSKNGLDNYPFLVKVVERVKKSNEKKSTVKKLFSHERLGQFLTKQYENIEKNITPHLFTDLETNLGIGIIDELQIISQMFLYELEDWFLLFQDHGHKFVEKWLAQSVDSSSSKIPKVAIDIILKKRELFRQAEKELKLSSEDLTLKYVIDRDWKFINFLTKEFMPDWYLTYRKQNADLIQWCTKSDFSVDKLGAKTMKMIGKFETSLENSVNALHYDDHLQFILKNIVYHEYGKIDTSNSKSKYALANMSSDFEPTSFMPKRALEMVLSSQASFVGGEMMDCMCLMKSCDNVLAGDLAERERIRVPLVGSRYLQKLDNNRTRYIELKMLNMVGILNTQLVWNVACKKLAVLNHNGLLAAMKRAELTDFQMPPLSKNQTMRTLHDNCKQQLGIDISQILCKKIM